MRGLSKPSGRRLARESGSARKFNTVATRGHVYLGLVDSEDAQAKTRANLWNTQGAAQLRKAEQARGETLRKGEKLFLLARPELHPEYGFSLVVSDIHFADTTGPAERALRQAIKRLTAEGIIGKNRGLAEPEIILRVALIAPRAAEGRQDFLQILAREFQLVSRRYETGAMLITSNRSVAEWGTVFADPVVATAILDRLLHHSHVLTIRGDSYRLRAKRKSGLIKPPAGDAPPVGSASLRPVTGETNLQPRS